MSDQSNAEVREKDHPGKEYFECVYTEIHNRHAGITDFRAKLLGLLPLATGTGVFLLLQRLQDPNNEVRAFLGPIGIFGVVVTVGLFVYELRGMQRCRKLEEQGEALEEEMRLFELGPFHGPKRRLGDMVGAPTAGLIIYLATAFAWLTLAGYGFKWPIDPACIFVGFVSLLAVSWILLWLSLRRSASPKP